LGETEPKPKLHSDGGPSRFWGRIGLTEDVADSLSDVVFKPFLIKLVKQLGAERCDRQPWNDLGGHTWESCRYLWDHANKL